jgi:hypothetical protein
VRRLVAALAPRLFVLLISMLAFVLTQKRRRVAALQIQKRRRVAALQIKDRQNDENFFFPGRFAWSVCGAAVSEAARFKVVRSIWRRMI